jgi:sodium-coupled neutral amino acid transporter 11
VRLLAPFRAAQAEKIFALTGCTAVCLVCYCIPVAIHVAVRRDQHRAAKRARTAARGAEPLGAGRAPDPTSSAPAGEEPGSELRAPLLEPLAGEACADGTDEPWWRRAAEWLVPFGVVAVGVGFSVAGLYVAVMDLLRYLHEQRGA